MFYSSTTQPRSFSKSFPLNVLQHYYSAKSQEVLPRVFLSMFYSTTTQPRVKRFFQEFSSQCSTALLLSQESRGFSKSFPLNVLQHHYSAKRFFQEFSSQCSTALLLSQESRGFSK